MLSISTKMGIDREFIPQLLASYQKIRELVVDLTKKQKPVLDLVKLKKDIKKFEIK